MTEAVVVLGLVSCLAIAGTVVMAYVLYMRERAHEGHTQWLVAQHSDERDQLLSRIQKPEYSPAPRSRNAVAVPVMDNETARALRQVGTVAPPE